MLKRFKADERAFIKLKEQLYKKQAKAIEKVFEDIADAIKADIAIKGDNYSEADIALLKKELNIQIKESKKNIEYIISSNLDLIMASSTVSHRRLLSSIDKKYKVNGLKEYDKKVDVKKRVNAIVRGLKYKDNKSLSKRIWMDNKGQIKDINMILREGLKNKKNPMLIAQDLEKYVRPSAKKDGDFIKTYAGVRKRVDYNAQRLAKTTLTHAYQEATLEAVRHNPVLEYVEYNAMHGARVCNLCATRDGKRFKVDEAPLDHPNGSCFLTAVIPDNIEDLIANYVNTNIK